jgi:hypothetical protein
MSFASGISHAPPPDGEPRVHRHACDFTGRPLPRPARSTGTVPRAGEATASASVPPLSVVCTGSKRCSDAGYIFVSQRAVGCVSALPGRVARGPSGPRAAHMPAAAPNSRSPTISLSSTPSTTAAISALPGGVPSLDLLRRETQSFNDPPCSQEATTTCLLSSEANR